MKNFSKKLIPIIIVTGYLLLVTVSIANAAAPTVILVSPTNGSINVPQRPTITALFDKDINSTTVNNDTFKLKNKFGTEINGEVSYSLSEKKASFKPDGLLPYDNKYTAIITTGVIDLAGNHLTSDYAWSFTTTVGTDLPIAYPGCSRPVGEYTMCSSGEVVCPDIGCPEEEPEEEPKEPPPPPPPPPPHGDDTNGDDTNGDDTNGDDTNGDDTNGDDTNGDDTKPFPKSGVEGIVPCGGPGQEPCTICDLFVGIKKIIDFLTIDIAMPLAVVVLIYGGVMILTSGGSEEKLKKGKQALWFTIWGLVIVFAGWLIVDTILKALMAGGVGNIKDWGPWNEIKTCK